MNSKLQTKFRRSSVRLQCHSLEGRLTPATFNIAAGDVAGLVAAINTSNTNNQSDIINLAVGSTYTFASRADDSFGGTALPEIDLDGGIATNSLTINGNGATVQRSSDATTPGFRFIEIGPVGSSASVAAVNVIINDLTMSGFNTQLPTDSFTPSGGAIHVNRANVTLTNCVLTGDSSDSGGAISVSGNTTQAVTLNQCTVTNNLGGTGAVQVLGPMLIVTGGTISNNIGGTGGIFFQSGTTCTVTGTVIQNNGGIGNGASGQVTLTRVTISGNARQGLSVQGTLNLVASTVSGNGTAGLDPTGGVSVEGSSGLTSNLTITNSTIDGNLGTTAGGIDVNKGSSTTFQAVITNCTVTNNQATSTGTSVGGIRIATW